MKKFGRKALSILKGIAPLAASAMGGPYAGAAMSILAKNLGVTEDKVEEYILSASPDQLLQLKLAEIELDRWREEAGIRKDEIAAKDRESARDLAKTRGVAIQASLSVLYTVGYFLTLFLFISGWAAVKPDYKEMVMVLIGALASPQLQILNFWFGSSQGSASKTDMLVKDI
jgi:hypothetical protein